MADTYLSVPRLHHLEYLDVLLNSCQDNIIDESRARQAVQQKIQEFEQDKARALRHQKFRAIEGVSTYLECIELAQQMGLIDRFKRLKPDAFSVLDPLLRRSFLLERIWQTYPRFSQIILSIRDVEQVDVPLYNWDEQRKQGKEFYGLNMDRKNFEILRDFAVQLGILNWYPTDNGRQIIYPTACVTTQTEFTTIIGRPTIQETYCQQCIYTTALELGIFEVADGFYHVLLNGFQSHPDYLILQTENERVFIKNHKINPSEFEQALWSEYLYLSDMVPMAPVLYPALRNKVCAKLRITDRIFDYQIKVLIHQPQKLNIHPSDGTLNYVANLAHISKLLPPQTSEGNFIVYLKLDRRKIS